MRSKKNYNDESNKLIKAIDIAIVTFEKFPTKHTVSTIESYKEFSELALNPEPKYANLKSLACLKDAAFNYFQEAIGVDVEYFWKRILQEKLEFKRENRLNKILERGKIKGRIEYDYAVDILVIAEQESRITSEEAQRLSNMIAEYEKKG